MPKKITKTPSPSAQTCQKIVQFLDESKGLNIVQFDVEGKSPFTDYVVIVSGTSGRHVTAMARNLERFCADEKIKINSITGKTAGDWVLIDCFDVIVHLFRPSVREYYNLERLWDPVSLPDATL